MCVVSARASQTPGQIFQDRIQWFFSVALSLSLFSISLRFRSVNDIDKDEIDSNRSITRHGEIACVAGDGLRQQIVDERHNAKQLTMALMPLPIDG